MPLTVSLEEAGPADPYDWVLRQPLTFMTVNPRQSFEIPLEVIPFQTDLASVPRFLTWLVPRYGLYTKAALIHDHLCSARPEDNPARDRFEADEIFREAMRELGVGWLRRWMMWGAVTWATIVPAIVRRGRWLPALALSVVILWVLTRQVWNAPPWTVFQWDVIPDLVRYALVDARLKWWRAFFETMLILVPSLLGICVLLNPSVRILIKMCQAAVFTMLALPFLVIGLLSQFALLCFWILEAIAQPSLAIQAFRRWQVKAKVYAATVALVNILAGRGIARVDSSLSPKTRRIVRALS